MIKEELSSITEDQINFDLSGGKERCVDLMHQMNQFSPQVREIIEHFAGKPLKSWKMMRATNRQTGQINLEKFYMRFPNASQEDVHEAGDWLDDWHSSGCSVVVGWTTWKREGML